MPSLIKHKNGIYYIILTQGSKRIWRSTHTKDKFLALQKYLAFGPTAQAKSFESEESQFVSDRLNGVTISKAVEEFMNYVKINHSIKTLKDYKSITRIMTEYFGGETLVLDIKIRDIERFKSAKFQTGVSPHTVNHNLRCMKAFFNRLVAWDMVAKNPCKGVKPLRIDDTIRPYLSREDLQAILTYTSGSQLHDIILFAAMTGLRLSELAGLSWEDILLEKKKIIVRSNSLFRRKSGKIRTIPINSEHYTMLDKMPEKKGVLFKGEDGVMQRPDLISK